MVAGCNIFGDGGVVGVSWMVVARYGWVVGPTFGSANIP